MRSAPPQPAATNDDAPAAKPSDKLRKKARRNIGALPKHLLRCEQVLEPEATACPCCQGQLHKICEDVSEVLDVIPAILAGKLRFLVKPWHRSGIPSSSTCPVQPPA
ncbi:IS66 family transposase zinc-finger binding domain-containing protein [Bradyrhizobium liaoningense]|uniref:IS66 family transposase zinc-finger binding domain-containing protein n=1 Tax=Bradyrhizobium liaoningense TaxID=43992 RepID=UPI0004BC5749|nr:IS66 family transposase zinc-finger binding domain-containing protein [Bradyrhizobium liaoningense]